MFLMFYYEFNNNIVEFPPQIKYCILVITLFSNSLKSFKFCIGITESVYWKYVY
jgi:hypothetical protein